MTKRTTKGRQGRRRWALTPKTVERTCAQCGEVFQARHADAMYCSNACKQQAWRERNVAAGTFTSHTAPDD